MVAYRRHTVVYGGTLEGGGWSVKFAILGPLEVRSASGRLLVPARRKQRILLALLILRANQFLRIDVIVDELWGAQPPSSAVANLHSYIAGLRRLFGAEASRLITESGGYRLACGAHELDYLLFENL